jgi:tetratricopeptide (TPR) repeat protein
VLDELAQRTNDTAKLEEAIAVLRSALQEGTRERVPINWARTQHNLGIALANLGRRESGTARLEEAVGAYREALKEYTRERVPLDWANTQNDLGSVLEELSTRRNDNAQLRDAIFAYREGLKETRETDRLRPVIQNNLSRAERLLAKQRN